jgi:hypothetical protein
MAALLGPAAPDEGHARPNEIGDAFLVVAMVGEGGEPDWHRTGARLNTQKSPLAHQRAEAGALAKERCVADECPNAATVFAAFVRGFDAALGAVDDALAELEATWPDRLAPL